MNKTIWMNNFYIGDNKIVCITTMNGCKYELANCNYIDTNYSGYFIFYRHGVDGFVDAFLGLFRVEDIKNIFVVDKR